MFLHLADDGAVVGDFCFDDLWGEEVSVAGDDGVGEGHLEGGDVEGVAEAGAAEGGGVIGAVEVAVYFAAEGDVGLLAAVSCLGIAGVAFDSGSKGVLFPCMTLDQPAPVEDQERLRHPHEPHLWSRWPRGALHYA